MRKYIDVTIHNGVFGQPFKAFHINITNKGERNMTKTQFIERFFKNAGLKHKIEAKRLTDTFLDTIKECISEGEKVEFMGFGTFEIKEKAERKGTNFGTGEQIIIPAMKVVKFKAGKELKEIVNK